MRLEGPLNAVDLLTNKRLLLRIPAQSLILVAQKTTRSPLVPVRVRVFFVFLALLLVTCCAPLKAQRPANSNAIYQQLRALLPGDDIIAANNLELRRDAATFTFVNGSFAFYTEVNGKITGAVFKGQGHFHLKPPTAEERHNLAILTHKEEFDEGFDRLVLRFTDATAAELHKGGKGKPAADESFAGEARDVHNFQRLKLLDNFDLRLLEDVLSPAQGGYFLALIHGEKNPHLVFTLDPHGAGQVTPEEVSLLSWNQWGESYPAAFHWAQDAARGGGSRERNSTFRVDHEDLGVSIERSGFLTGQATVHLIAEQDGVAVAQLAVYPTLRVSRVETDKGEPLDFVQEKKEEDADFGVVLAKPLKKGESATLRISYAGKDVVRNEGNANYYPIARQSWYPNGSSGLGD